MKMNYPQSIDYPTKKFTYCVFKLEIILKFLKINKKFQMYKIHNRRNFKHKQKFWILGYIYIRTNWIRRSIDDDFPIFYIFQQFFGNNVKICRSFDGRFCVISCRVWPLIYFLFTSFSRLKTYRADNICQAIGFLGVGLPAKSDLTGSKLSTRWRFYHQCTRV